MLDWLLRTRLHFAAATGAACALGVQALAHVNLDIGWAITQASSHLDQRHGISLYDILSLSTIIGLSAFVGYQRWLLMLLLDPVGVDCPITQAFRYRRYLRSKQRACLYITFWLYILLWPLLELGAWVDRKVATNPRATGCTNSASR